MNVCSGLMPALLDEPVLVPDCRADDEYCTRLYVVESTVKQRIVFSMALLTVRGFPNFNWDIIK